MLRTILFVIYLFLVKHVIAQDTTSVFKNPAAAGNNTDSLMNSDDYLVGGSYMLLKEIQIRIVSGLLTHQETYNNGMTRVNNYSRNTLFNFSVQGWFKLNDKTNLGLIANVRKIQVDDFGASSMEIFSYSNSAATKTVFRTVTPTVKYLFLNKSFRLIYQSAFTIPVSKAFELEHGEINFTDANPAQWINQVYWIRNYSEWFILNLELNAAIRFGQTETIRLFTMRAGVTPVFNYYFNPGFRFYVFAELNPLITDGFFSSFVFREGAGLTFRANNSLSFDGLYSYVALGKKTAAQNNIVLGVRFSF